ncbi:MAG: 50S ribosomal protein L11 methyltransferase [Pseudomonadota bacterium]
MTQYTPNAAAGVAHKLVWTGPRAALEAAATILTEVIGADAVSVRKEDLLADDGAPDVLWRLDGYWEEKPDAPSVGAMLAEFVPGWADVAAPEAEETPDIDWVAHALAGLGIIRAGRFLAYGVHDADEVTALREAEPHLIPIRIDANQAFGTGHHPTTAGCLTAIDALPDAPPGRILDLGAGSCVLAIAAAKRWGVPVLASDIDATSVAIGRENAALNDVSDLVTVIEADGFAAGEIDARVPFNLVFANILAGPLAEFAPAAAGHMTRGCRVILAGLLADQETAVRTAYETAGFALEARRDHPSWPVLVMTKQ